MKFSYSAVWNETVRLIRAHGSILIALAGVFIFLPDLLTAYLIPQPEPVTLSEMFLQLEEYLLANWHWLLLVNLVNMTGAIAIILLIMGRDATVGAIIAAAVGLLPFYFLASLVSGFIVTFGLIFLIVPGLYLAGRLATVTPVVAAEGRRNPLDAVKRSFELTRGHGWAVVGLVILVVVAGAVLGMVVTGILSILFIVVAGADVGGLLALVVKAAAGAALSTLLIVLLTAIYRTLAERGSAAIAAGERNLRGDIGRQ